jgi:hypothetical protein
MSTVTEQNPRLVAITEAAVSELEGDPAQAVRNLTDPVRNLTDPVRNLTDPVRNLTDRIEEILERS